MEEGHYNAASIIDQVMTEIKNEHQKKLREVTDPRRMKFKQLKEKCAEYGIETKGVKQQLVDRILEHERMLEEKRKAEEHKKKLEEALAKKKKAAEEKRKRKIAERMKGKRKRKKKVKKESKLSRLFGLKSKTKEVSLSSSSSSEEEEDDSETKLLGSDGEEEEEVLMPEEIEAIKREEEEKKNRIQQVKDAARDAALVALHAARDAGAEVPDVMRRISDLVTYITIDWRRVKIYFSRFRTLAKSKSSWSLNVDVEGHDESVRTVCSDPSSSSFSHVQMSLSEDVGVESGDVALRLSLYDDEDTLCGISRIKLGRSEMLRLRRGQYVFWDVRFDEAETKDCVDVSQDDVIEVEDVSKDVSKDEEKDVSKDEEKEVSKDEEKEDHDEESKSKPPGLEGFDLEHTISSGAAPSITRTPSMNNTVRNNTVDPIFNEDWSRLQKLRSRLGNAKMSAQKRFHELDVAKKTYRDIPDEPKGRKRHYKRLAKQAQRRYKDANQHVENLVRHERCRAQILSGRSCTCQDRFGRDGNA